MKPLYEARSDKKHGRIAFVNGVARTQCPHPKGTPFAEYWLKGWDEEKEKTDKMRAEHERQQAEMRKYKEALSNHDNAYAALVDKLIELGIDPHELRNYLREMPD